MNYGPCYYGCGTTTDLRPYGPGGAPVCFPCATATPERERATETVFGVVLEAAEAVGGGVSVLTESGPQPYRGGTLGQAK